MRFSDDIEVSTTREWRIMDKDNDLAEATVTARSPSGSVLTDISFHRGDDLSKDERALIERIEAEAEAWLTKTNEETTMNDDQISIRTLANQASHVIRQVVEGHTRYVITRHNRPVAILAPIHDEGCLHKEPGVTICDCTRQGLKAADLPGPAPKRPKDTIGQLRFEYTVQDDYHQRTSGKEAEFHRGVMDGLKIAAQIIGFDISP